MKRVLVFIVIGVLTANAAFAQLPDSAAVWRSFAEKIEVGAAIKVRLREGGRFTATLVQARPDALVLQRKTRLPVPVEAIAYDAIVAIERDKGRGSAAKAAAIGVATGVGTFFGILFVMLAAIDD